MPLLVHLGAVSQLNQKAKHFWVNRLFNRLV